MKPHDGEQTMTKFSFFGEYIAWILPSLGIDKNKKMADCLIQYRAEK